MVRINPDHGAQIADGYDALRHSPNEPETKAAYDALINETRQQYDKLVEGGLKVTKSHFWTESEAPKEVSAKDFDRLKEEEKK